MKIQLLLLSIFSLLSFEYIHAHEGNMQDLKLIKYVKDHGSKYEYNRSILWVENNYLSSHEITSHHNLIDTGIVSVEKYLGTDYDPDEYNSCEKIEQFINSRREASHTITGY